MTVTASEAHPLGANRGHGMRHVLLSAAEQSRNAPMIFAELGDQESNSGGYFEVILSLYSGLHKYIGKKIAKTQTHHPWSGPHISPLSTRRKTEWTGQSIFLALVIGSDSNN